MIAPFLEGRLAFVHACGLVDPTRSHFDAMRMVETSCTSGPSERTGWLARALASTPSRAGGPLRAISVDRFLPRSLCGADGALAVLEPSDYRGFLGRPAAQPLRADLERAWSGAGAAGRSALDSLAMLDRIHVDARQPPRGAPYPDGELGTSLAKVAAWIRADAGIDVLTLEYGGWDTHGDMGVHHGLFAKKTAELASALWAFDRDLGSLRERVTLIAMTEFGRRVRENASGGTDHGHGACWIVMGGGIRGGRVVTRWPGLGPEDLDSGDLAITIDARDVLGEILVRRAGCADLETVFPLYTPSFVGLTV
jgi:uncharacterized protein (DUF1501 family)